MSEYVSEILAFIFIAVGVVYFNGKILNVLGEKLLSSWIVRINSNGIIYEVINCGEV